MSEDARLTGWNKDSELSGDCVLDWFAEGGEVVREVVKLMTSGEKLPHPNQKSKCYWHVHKTTPKCDNVK